MIKLFIEGFAQQLVAKKVRMNVDGITHDSAVIKHDSAASLVVGIRFEFLVVKVRFGKGPCVPRPFTENYST